MAIEVTAVWEVRTATGSDNNGGGFDPGVTSPGTDYSQQASPQVVFNGTSIAATTSGVSATIVITGHTVVSGDNGNMLQITGGTGFIAGVYTILSVNTGANSWTLDRNCTSSAGTAMTGNMGGAFATLTQAVSVAAQMNQIWATGSQTLTSTLTLSLAFSSITLPPFSITGYGTARGDGTRFTLTTSTNSVHLITYASGAGQTVLRNLLLSSTAGSPGNGIQTGTGGASTDLVLDNCRLTGFNLGINGPFSGEYFIAPLTLNNCEVDHCVSHGVLNTGFNYILNCFIHDNGGSGLLANAASQGAEGFIAVGTCFYANAGDGVTQDTNSASNDAAGGALINCNLVGNGGGYTCSGAISFSAINCIFYGNTGTALNTSGSTIVVGVQYNNAFGSNGANRGGFPAGTADITLTADPFNNPTGGDFSLNSTSGGGAACKAAGFQSTEL